MARTMLTIAMAPELHKRLQSVSSEVGKRALSKVACELIEAGLARRGFLVAYETDEQKDSGEPVIVAEGATRVWANASWLKGWAEPGALSQELWDAVKGLQAKAPSSGRRGMAEWIAGALRALEWTVQVVDDRKADILEVWAHKPLGKCAHCPKLDRIREALDAED